MTSPQTINLRNQFPDILFQYTKMLIWGSYCILFLSAYITFEPSVFNERLKIYQDWSKYILLTGVLLGFLSFLLMKNNRYYNLSWQSILLSKEKSITFNLFLLLLALTIFVQLIREPLPILNFLSFLIAMYGIFNMAKVYTFSFSRPSWQHPTTASSIVQGVAAMGIVIGLAIYQQSSLYQTFSWILLIVLFLEALTLWARLRYLSKANQVTHQTVRMMLGSHLSFFGVRFIFGLVMPLVYLIWSLFIARLPHSSLIPMIFVGEFTERILFFITAMPFHKTSTISANKNTSTQQTTGEP